jgi:cytochrome P450
MPASREFAETDSPSTPPAGCPVSHGASQRKSDRGAPPDAPGIERRGDTWHLRSYAAVRQVLRDAESTRQAGFNAEMVDRTGLRQPVLFQDGPEHKEQRTAIARFFTPKTVGDVYRALMEELSDELVAELVRARRGDLSELSLALAVQVAARVVGLTDSRVPGMARRLEAVLSLERLEDLSRLRRGVAMLASQAHLLRFYMQDVRPAIAARRRVPREDVISHLLGKGYKDSEILIECITYGAAGMATTREYIGIAAWHLLDDEPLRRDYLAGDEDERHRILHEILRLEPVVGQLYRRATDDIVIEHGGEATRIPAGSRIVMDVRAANADPAAVGDEPLRVCPHRELGAGVQPSVLSFGDGAHRCPGAFIAITESDVFLQRLLRLPLEVTRPPRLEWNDLIESYEVRGFEVAVRPATPTAD